jgi:hypothetical protein
MRRRSTIIRRRSAKIRELTGAATIKAVIHCQGSTSFMMSIAAGLLPEVDTVVSNAVALHTLVPPMAWWKAMLATNTIGATVDYVNPQWGLYVTGFWPRMIDLWVRMTHHECRNAVCKHSSFTYGSGFPDAVAARESQRRHARMAEGRVRPRADELLPADEENASPGAISSRPANTTNCPPISAPRRRGRTRASSSSAASTINASPPPAWPHLRFFRQLRARQARLPGACRLRPSRRVHRQERPSRRLSR